VGNTIAGEALADILRKRRIVDRDKLPGMLRREVRARGGTYESTSLTNARSEADPLLRPYGVVSVSTHVWTTPPGWQPGEDFVARCPALGPVLQAIADSTGGLNHRGVAAKALGITGKLTDKTVARINSYMKRVRDVAPVETVWRVGLQSIDEPRRGRRKRSPLAVRAKQLERYKVMTMEEEAELEAKTLRLRLEREEAELCGRLNRPSS
jgi:hypothetical protein